MGPHRSSEHTYEQDDNGGFVAIGEVRSEEDGRRATAILSQHGIPFEWGYGESPVDELRRFFGDWHEGLRLIVQPQDVERALAAVRSMLTPAKIWLNGTSYLEQRSTEELVRLLDFRTIWKDPIPGVAEHVLASRGVVYPPDGGCSPALPFVYGALIFLFSPFINLLLMPLINRKKHTKDGGSRPRHDEKTRERLTRSLKHGTIIWCMSYAIVILIFKAVIPNPQKHEPAKQIVPAR